MHKPVQCTYVDLNLQGETVSGAGIIHIWLCAWSIILHISVTVEIDFFFEKCD